MAVLDDYQFEVEGFVFGYGASIATNEDGFDPGSDEITSQDNERYGSDAYAFGQDTKRPSPWTWELHTDDAEDDVTAVADMGELAGIWMGDNYRKTPSKVTALRYQIAGRTRVVFGRTRRWAPAMDNGILSGLLNIVCDFQRADTLFYGDDVQSSQITVTPATPIGFATPLIFPLSTLVSVPREGTIASVGGNVPAPFTVVIQGPILNPKISTDDWQIELLTSIPAGMSVTISTYPWDYRAIRSDGANLSGTLSARSRLSKARLSPAGDTLYFDGTDGTGDAVCTLFWRPAFTSM